jgi:hypothetical protein
MRRWALVAAGCLLSFTAGAEGFFDRFRDPEDGKFDASSYLLDHRGVLPVPIVITEPAVGYGGGVALSWFSESIGEAAERARATGHRLTPPNIYVLALFGTENGTKGAGAGARISFLDDTVRYRGGLADISVNLDFYGVGGALAPGLDKIGYNLSGYGTLHEVTRRLGSTDHWVGLRWFYMSLETRLDFGTAEDAGLTPRELSKKNSALGITYVYDSRDNIFTTRRGVQAALDGMFYSPDFGSDTSFRTYRAHVFAYIPAQEQLTLALRADGRTARGEVPFYQLPFIDMRGAPAARYQDENTAVAELEARYYVTPRWIALAFVGAGRAWGRRTSFDDEGTVVAKGVGFRYMLARRMGLSLGIDVARGPEKTAWYLNVGNAWR